MTTIPLPGNVSLSITSGPDTGREMVLDKAEVLIGRDKGCDFVVNDPYVSKQHCKIIYKEGYFVIEDCESLNRTLVNNEDDAINRLKNGDVINLGKTVLEFHWEADDQFEWL